MVMMTVDTPTTVERGKGRNVSWSASRFAKLWEAEAEVRKPDRVTPIWMVERKRLGELYQLFGFLVALFRHLFQLAVV